MEILSDFILILFAFLAPTIWTKKWSKEYDHGYSSGATHTELYIYKILSGIIAFILFFVFVIPYISSGSTNKIESKIISKEVRDFEENDIVTIPSNDYVFTCIKQSSENFGIFAYHTLPRYGKYGGDGHLKYEKYLIVTEEDTSKRETKKTWQFGGEKITKYERIFIYRCIPENNK